MTDDVLMGSEDELDRARVVLQQWLHQTLLFPGVKESQPLRNFLCASANAPPPRLEIRWASSHCPSLDEMQMDELFDRHLEDREASRGTKGIEIRGREGREKDRKGDQNGPEMAEKRDTSLKRVAERDRNIWETAKKPINRPEETEDETKSDSICRDDHTRYWASREKKPVESSGCRRRVVLILALSRGGGGGGSSGAALGPRLNIVGVFYRNPSIVAITLLALSLPPLPSTKPVPVPSPLLYSCCFSLSCSLSFSLSLPFRYPYPCFCFTFSANASSSESPSPPEERPADATTTGHGGGAGVAESGGGGGAGVGDSGMGGGTPVALAKRKVGLDSFKIVRVIGKGSFGKVFLVREKVAGDIYAMKVLRKDNIIKRNQVEHTKTERNVLGYVKHPFIVGLNMAFQTRDKLFFVLDYCAGGELFFHLAKLGKFPEARSRFYSAEITLALQHVHRLNIVYRDLKPENVLLDAEGHIRLTDFGLSKEGISNTTSGAHSFCGTPEYLAPEILNRQGHGRAVDWWSLGALLYEMVTGLPPFYCRDREKLFEKIRRGNLSYPRYLSAHAQQILQGLLTRDPSKRLGSSLDDAQEVQRHPFFAPLNWDRIMRREVAPPWEPTVVGSLDTSQFDREFTSMPIFSPDQRDHKLGQSSTSNDDTFEGFTFIDSSSHLHNTTTATTTTIDPLSCATTPSLSGASSATPPPPPQGAAAAAAAAAAVTVTPTTIRPQRLLVDHMDTPDV
eukprot:jgi/Undpi1/1729/HiC_scaffold_11.g05119.m1